MQAIFSKNDFLRMHQSLYPKTGKHNNLVIYWVYKGSDIHDTIHPSTDLQPLVGIFL